MLLVPAGSLGFTLTLRKHERGLEEERGWISRTEEDDRPDASGIGFFIFFFNHTATDSREQQELSEDMLL